MRTRAAVTTLLAATAAAVALLAPAGASANPTMYCSPDCDVVVDSTADEPDADPGDGACATAAGDCTLRAAIQEANQAGVANVLVPPGEYVLSRHGLDDDASHGDLDVAFHGQVVGAGSSQTVVDGDEADRVFDLHIGEVQLAHLAVVHGRATDGPGGGIRTGAGELAYYAIVSYLFVAHNEAVAGAASGSGNGGGIGASRDTLVYGNEVEDNAAVNGGGLYWSGAQASASGGNTFTGNHASGDGGGIYMSGHDTGIGGTTITGNSADGHGGGARVPVTDSAWGFEDIGGSTIASNSAPKGMGGGIWIDGTPPDDNSSRMTGVIVAGNGAGGDCAGGARYVSLGGNVDGDGSCGFDAASDRAAVDPLLDALADNGGPVKTRALLDGSPAIDLWACAKDRVCDSGAFQADSCCRPPDIDPYVPPEPEEPPPGDPPAVKTGHCGVLRFGTPVSDLLVGDDGHNQIHGRGGDDHIYGRFQSDCLYGGAGDDTIRGDEGTDLLVGFTGDDRLNGGADEDVVRGGRGADWILGGADEDRLFGGPDSDYIKGGDGYDTIAAGPGDDSVDASGGDLDTVDCGPGEDRVRAKRDERLTGCEHVHYVD
jgi:CSLREA domain-containing protein